MLGIWAVDVDAANRPDERNGLERVARLLAGAEQAERLRIRPRDLIDRDGRRRADAHAGQ